MIFERPLFVGAHVDDVELFAGATLCQVASRAMVVAFSKHEGVRPSPRAEHVRSFQDILKVKNWEVGDLKAVCGEFESKRELIAEQLRRARDSFRPTVVVTHQSSDTNQDHQAVYREVLRVFKYKASIICGTFPFNELPAVERRLIKEVKESEVKAKCAALACYKSQKAGRPYFSKNFWTHFHGLWGGLIGVPYAEPFEVVSLIM